MAEPLKNIFNDSFFVRFTKALKQVYPDFMESLFLKQVHDEDWERQELKQRAACNFAYSKWQ